MKLQLKRLFDSGRFTSYEKGGRVIDSDVDYELVLRDDGEYVVRNPLYKVAHLPILNGVVYIAGPMRGYPELNFPEFDRVRDSLISKGFYVFSPADLNRIHGKDIGDLTALPSDVVIHPDNAGGQKMASPLLRTLMKHDMNAISESTHISLLDGWEDSWGVRPEAVTSYTLGLNYFLKDDPQNVVPGVSVMAVVGYRLVAQYNLWASEQAR